MQINKEHLDIPFSKLLEGADNQETPREFIRSTEREFELRKMDIEAMSTDDLNHYIEFLDYLWNK
ncbi:hypothetical protein AB3Z07_21300 [Metabacillus halosaccharovorans]|uniref:hypothetical protein n=1 Tax=Metabacillus halosaccharovorans TaxID=930124 RepID=UPI0034CEF8C4